MKRSKLTLFVFIDALGWEVLNRHPFFLEDILVDRHKVETILGYSSACDPSIISGLTPAEHGLWSSFYYAPGRCTYAWLRHFRFLPGSLMDRGRVRGWMSRAIRRVHGFTGYFQLYAVPFQWLPLFDYAEKHSIWVPGGLPRGKTIFDLLSELGRPYSVHRSHTPDEQRLAELTARVRARSIEFGYVSLGRLDAYMHAHGPLDPGVGGVLEGYDARIRALLAEAQQGYEEVALYILTDHGMHTVRETCDVQSVVEALGYRFGVDYVAFYDATMVRFWVLNEGVRAPLVSALGGIDKGRLLTEAELEGMGVMFPDHQYGDLVFLMDSGVQVLPSFMGARYTKGLHGFHPSDPDSAAMLAGNRPIPDPPARVEGIYHVMLRELGLDALYGAGGRPLSSGERGR